MREIVGVPGRVEQGIIEVSDLFHLSGDELVRGDGYPPHEERFARAGYRLSDLLAGSHDAVLGLTLGRGSVLVWWSFWPPRTGAAQPGRLARAHPGPSHPGGSAGRHSVGARRTSIAVGLVVAVLRVGGVGFARHRARLRVPSPRAGPFALVQARAAKRQASMREVWPDVVDNLASGIRAGLSLPEALGQLGERGPEHLREPFMAFAEDFRASGRFGDSLDALKARLADPVGDRIVEALRLTRDVGGTDVGRLLRTLSEFLRDDARTRGELEARQSWTVNAARLAVAAPWVVLALLSTRPENAAAYNSASGFTVLLLGGGSTVLAYRLMVRLGRLPEESRVLR